MTAIHVFIISWKGQHERAAAIARSLEAHTDRLSVVYSDPGEQPACLEGHHPIRRDNDLFWADKFQACLEYCAPDEIMLLIHADCRCDDWPEIVTLCRAGFARFPDMGVWAPRLTGTPWRPERIRMKRIPGTQCCTVAQTDGLVFALSPALYPRMKQADYSGNLYGLGIDWMFVSAAYARGMTAIVDESITVHHPVTRGYSTKEARAMKHAFLLQMPPDEQAAYKRIRIHALKRKFISNFLSKIEKLNYKTLMVTKK